MVVLSQREWRSSDRPLRAAEFRRNGILRNISFFEDGSQNTYTAPPLAHEGNRVGGAGRHDGCDSGVYPGEGSWYGEVSFRGYGAPVYLFFLSMTNNVMTNNAGKWIYLVNLCFLIGVK